MDCECAGKLRFHIQTICSLDQSSQTWAAATCKVCYQEHACEGAFDWPMLRSMLQIVSGQRRICLPEPCVGMQCSY